MLSNEHVAWQHGQSTRARPGHVRESPVEIGGTSRLNELKPYPQPPCRDFWSRQHLLVRAFAEGTWQPEDSDLTTPGTACVSSSSRLPTSSESRLDNPVILPPGRARLVTSPLATGSAAEVKTMGRVLVACLAARAVCVPYGHDDINLERNQFGRKSGEPLELPLGISVFDHDVATLDVTEVTQSLKEGLAQVGVSGQVVRQVAYSSDLGRLLGLGGERRGKKRTGRDQEFPALDSVHAPPPRKDRRKVYA